MRFMVIVKADESSESGIMPDEKFMTAMEKFNEELANAGVWVIGEGLQPSSKGSRVVCKKGNYIVTDGPFAETKELIAGVWIWKLNSKEEAIEWIKRSPFDGGAVIEIRPLYEFEDLGDHATPEMREREKQLREQAATNKYK